MTQSPRETPKTSPMTVLGWLCLAVAASAVVARLFGAMLSSSDVRNIVLLAIAGILVAALE